MLVFLALAGWLAGLLFAERHALETSSLIGAAGTMVLATLASRSDRRVVALGVAATAFLFGTARMDHALSSPLAELRSRPQVRVTGIVTGQPAPGLFLLEASEPVPGRALFDSLPGSKLRYGDLVTVTGSPAEPSGLEPYVATTARASLASLVLRDSRASILAWDRGSPLGEALYRARFQLSVVLERHLPRQYGPVATGLLLGGTEVLDPDTKAAFRASGTSHILAASGYNVTVFAGVLLALAMPLLGRRRALPVALVAILVYAGLAGFSASVVRAALMAGIGVVGTWLGRQRDAGRALAAAAILMTFWQPGTVFDVGAQLSFAATAGLLWIEPIVAQALGWLWRPLAEAAGVTLTAQVATLPLGLYYFESLPSWSVLANVIVAPFVPVAMALSAVTILGGLLWYPLGNLLGAADALALRMIVGTAGAVASLPGASLSTGSIGIATLAGYYAAVAAAVALFGENLRAVISELRSLR